MPFKSEKQRRYLWRNEPKMARKWADEEKALAIEKPTYTQVSDPNLSPDQTRMGRQMLETTVSATPQQAKKYEDLSAKASQRVDSHYKDTKTVSRAQYAPAKIVRGQQAQQKHPEDYDFKVITTHNGDYKVKRDQGQTQNVTAPVNPRNVRKPSGYTKVGGQFTGFADDTTPVGDWKPRPKADIERDKKKRLVAYDELDKYRKQEFAKSMYGNNQKRDVSGRYSSVDTRHNKYLQAKPKPQQKKPSFGLRMLMPPPTESYSL